MNRFDPSSEIVIFRKLFENPSPPFLLAQLDEKFPSSLIPPHCLSGGCPPSDDVHYTARSLHSVWRCVNKSFVKGQRARTTIKAHVSIAPRMFNVQRNFRVRHAQDHTIIFCNLQQETIFYLNLQRETIFFSNLQRETIFFSNLQRETIYFCNLQRETPQFCRRRLQRVI